MIEVTDDIKNQISSFIEANTGEENIDENENIFETGLVNSLFAIELITFIERTFGFKVTIQDLDLERFSSISRINDFINVKLST